MVGSLSDNKRNSVVDWLRTIGTLLVILAHVEAPNSVLLVRSFDVCLLVMISGFCYSSKKNVSYVEYVIKRLRRLAYPSWVAMTVVLVLAGILCLIAGKGYIFTAKQILESILFLGGLEGGIGFFWIVRIYLLMAIFAPVMYKQIESVKNDKYFIALLFMLLILNQIVYMFFFGKNALWDFILENFILSTLGYAAVYMLGMRLNSSKLSKVKVLGLFAFVGVLISILFLVNGMQYVVAEYKYPPQMPYLLYGICGSLVLWLSMEKTISRCKVLEKWTPIWFSKNSFNIYLVHIIVIKMMVWGNRIIERVQVLNHWTVRFLVVVIISCIVVLVAEKGKHKYEKSRNI